VSTHDAHSSFIKTPQQLIVVILLSFVVPIFGIVLLVQLVTGRPGADPNALTSEAVSARIQPVAKLEVGAGGGAAAGTRSGEEIVKSTCAACHQAGVANAPKIGDKAAWAPRIKTGLNTLVATATKGKGAMPPKGGNSSLTDEEVTRAVVYMANQAGAGFKEPAAPKAKPAAGQQAAAGGDGKAVFDKVCTVCHTAGVAGAPKLGDKAAWAPRIKTGMDSLMQSVIKGKGAMPPKAGNPALSDAEIRAGIEYMVSQSK